MTPPDRQLPSVRALWAILWRAVLFFPLGVLIALLPFVILFAGTLLAVWALTFGVLGQWWHASACVAGLPLVVLAARWYIRRESRVVVPPPEPHGGGGYLL